MQASREACQSRSTRLAEGRQTMQASREACQSRTTRLAEGRQTMQASREACDCPRQPPSRLSTTRIEYPPPRELSSGPLPRALHCTALVSRCSILAPLRRVKRQVSYPLNSITRQPITCLHRPPAYHLSPSPASLSPVSIARQPITCLHRPPAYHLSPSPASLSPVSIARQPITCHHHTPVYHLSPSPARRLGMLPTHTAPDSRGSRLTDLPTSIRACPRLALPTCANTLLLAPPHAQDPRGIATPMRCQLAVLRNSTPISDAPHLHAYELCSAFTYFVRAWQDCMVRLHGKTAWQD
jgi:hypothetical protein